MKKDADQKLKRFTHRQLKEFDGRDGRPAYLAFKGKVFDVTDSSLWREGQHQGRHFAGDDLTEHVVNAPHGEEVLAAFPIVGEVTRENVIEQRLISRIESLHLHPILVHFSIAYSLVVPLLVILYILTEQTSFEIASYYMLTLGFIAAPFSGITGFFSWKITYEGRMTRIFFRKISFTIALIAVTTLCFLGRTLNPSILITKTKLTYIFLGLLDRLVPLDYIYFGLILSFVPIATILGYYGGKIVYS